MAGMGNDRHLETGSIEPPPPGKDVVRVYGMKFCPYVQRLKLVLAAKEVKHETININLTRKPEWYFEKNPRGLVPTLEINDDIIFESDITAAYVDAVYPGRKLMTENPLKKAKEQMLLGDHGKTVSGFYKYVLSPDQAGKDEAVETTKLGLSAFEKFLKQAKTAFVCGDQPGFTDYMMWPHIERIGVFIPDLIPTFKLVKKYFDDMGSDSAVKACRHSNELHSKFFNIEENLRTGEKRRLYDCGEVLEYNFPNKK
uniref:Glutathione S-transferase omega n=1 Tax=Phallusia mammillata TaxID=59560 RepID=A0A6F9DEQ9_9ASCI|nr:glutathione S-transferase omega-1-like [Phallusia mammillata]